MRGGDVLVEYREIHGRIRARHETINRRFKQFSILTATFRHSLNLPGYLLHAIANLSYVSMELGENHFDIEL